MKKTKLTNYDLHVLKESGMSANDYVKSTQLGSYSNPYEEYLINQLRRTTPSAERVLKENEFYAEKELENVQVDEGNYTAVAKPEKTHRFRLRKGGKIFLAIYVILIIALASILIVTNTTKPVVLDGIAFEQNADAASLDETVSDGKTIRAMSVAEEETDETNWFDKLCDSLNNK